MRAIYVLVIAAALTVSSSAGAEDGPKVRRGSGGSIQTNLGSGIVLNKQSSLQREWIVVDDPRLPVSIRGVTGARTIYKPGKRYSSGSYMYAADLDLGVTDDVSAFEIRFVTFDIWGERRRVLSLASIKDLAPGRHKEDAEWRVHSEHETSQYYASIAYVARVRTKSGKVLRANPQAVLAEARKFSEKFSESDLDPSAPKK